MRQMLTRLNELLLVVPPPGGRKARDEYNRPTPSDCLRENYRMNRDPLKLFPSYLLRAGENIKIFQGVKFVSPGIAGC